VCRKARLSRMHGSLTLFAVTAQQWVARSSSFRKDTGRKWTSREVLYKCWDLAWQHSRYAEGWAAHSTASVSFPLFSSLGMNLNYFMQLILIITNKLVVTWGSATNFINCRLLYEINKSESGHWSTFL
jgi:hypothetical protein